MSLTGMKKHIRLLEEAQLVTTEKVGTVVEEMDVRPGGKYRFRTAHGVVEGEFREVDAPERLGAKSGFARVDALLQRLQMETR
jgi:uncharacterized protein YndB with AHSA1/START domain